MQIEIKRIWECTVLFEIYLVFKTLSVSHNHQSKCTLRMNGSTAQKLYCNIDLQIVTSSDIVMFEAGNTTYVRGGLATDKASDEQQLFLSL